jgi:hypothetical protein
MFSPEPLPEEVGDDIDGATDGDNFEEMLGKGSAMEDPSDSPTSANVEKHIKMMDVIGEFEANQNVQGDAYDKYGVPIGKKQPARSDGCVDMEDDGSHAPSESPTPDPSELPTLTATPTATPTVEATAIPTETAPAN